MLENEWDELAKKLPSIAAGAFDTQRIRREFYDAKGKAAVKALQKNGFEAYYAKDRGEAAELLLSLVPPGATVGCGDSHTLFALGAEDALKARGCTLISHLCALNAHAQESGEYGYIKLGTKRQMREILMRYLVSDVFILGANGISMDGQIVNVDGAGNRVAGSMYGPDRIIVVAGVNKLAPDVEAARARVGFTAAPMNNIKYDSAMPCVTTGKCADCARPERICNMTAVIHKKPLDSDFHVIIIGEELGF